MSEAEPWAEARNNTTTLLLGIPWQADCVFLIFAIASQRSLGAPETTNRARNKLIQPGSWALPRKRPQLAEPEHTESGPPATDTPIETAPIRTGRFNVNVYTTVQTTSTEGMGDGWKQQRRFREKRKRTGRRRKNMAFWVASIVYNSLPWHVFGSFPFFLVGFLFYYPSIPR